MFWSGMVIGLESLISREAGTSGAWAFKYSLKYIGKDKPFNAYLMRFNLHAKNVIHI